MRASTCFESSDALNILDYNLVAHSAVNHATNQVSGVKFVWESKLNPTRFIQRLQLLGRKRNIGTHKVVLELGQLSRADNGNDRYWPITQPGQGDLCHAATHLVRHGFNSCDNALSSLLFRHELLHHIASHATGFSRAVPMIFTGKHTARKGRPCSYAKVQRLGHRDQFAFDRSLDQAVFNLQSNKWRPAT